MSIDYLSILSDNRYLIHRLLIDYLSITSDYRLYRLSMSGFLRPADAPDLIGVAGENLPQVSESDIGNSFPGFESDFHFEIGL